MDLGNVADMTPITCESQSGVRRQLMARHPIGNIPCALYDGDHAGGHETWPKATGRVTLALAGIGTAQQRQLKVDRVAARGVCDFVQERLEYPGMRVIARCA